jgi:hypothetical protein
MAPACCIGTTLTWTALPGARRSVCSHSVPLEVAPEAR